MKVSAYAAQSPTDQLKPFAVDRRTVGEKDIQIDIVYCGICHSDVHTARNEWRNTVYPSVPGHEIIGKVSAVGADVIRFKVGDWAGVGCLVDSCGHCASCKDDMEQFCEKGATFTYNSPDLKSGGSTYGGYSEKIVVDESFVLRVPENLDKKAAAPLLCAGITTYSPLRRFGVGVGQRVGVIGLGGLGHMAVKLAAAMGAHVVMITSSKHKAEDAKRLGAKEVLISTDAAAMEKNHSSFDFLLNTVPAPHSLDAYLPLLKLKGTMAIVGATHIELDSLGVIIGRKSIAGSLIGGIKETQEMLDFCGQHGVVSDIEMINIQYINEAYERMIKSDVKYRFVIDMKSIKV